MSKELRFFFAIVLILQLASSHSLPAEHAASAEGADTSLQGLGGVKPDITHGNGNIRRRRATISDAGSDPGTSVAPTEQPASAMSSISDTLQSIGLAPFNLIWRIAAVPLNIVGNVINWGMGMILNLIGAGMDRSWSIARIYIIPQLDKISLRLGTSDHLPQQMKTLFMSFHSTYMFMKLFGYLKPS